MTETERAGWQSELDELIELDRVEGFTAAQDAEQQIHDALDLALGRCDLYGQVKLAARSRAQRRENLRRALGQSYTTIPPSVGLSTQPALRRKLEQIEQMISRGRPAPTEEDDDGEDRAPPGTGREAGSPEEPGAGDRGVDRAEEAEIPQPRPRLAEPPEASEPEEHEPMTKPQTCATASPGSRTSLARSTGR